MFIRSSTSFKHDISHHCCGRESLLRDGLPRRFAARDDLVDNEIGILFQMLGV